MAGLAALAGVAVLVAVLVAQQGREPGEAPESATAPHALEVVGSQGRLLWNGTVLRPVATPLELLQEAAQGNFTIDVQQRTAFGPGCQGLYVIQIGADRETLSGGGWNYYTRNGSPWTWQGVGAGCFLLSPGDAVQWRWVEGGP